MLMASAVFTACDYEKDFEQPPLEDYVPRATMVANTTCDELKTLFNQDVNYYNVLVGTRADGQHYIVKGRVTSDDAAGNVYKKSPSRTRPAASSSRSTAPNSARPTATARKL